MERCSDVEKLVRDFYDIVQSGDLNAFAASLAAGDATLMIGTDPQEWWVGAETILGRFRVQHEVLGGLPIEPGSPDAWAEGSVAWFADRPTLSLPDNLVRLRLTGVALHQDDAWRIVQAHLSVGESNVETLGQELPF